MPTEPLPEVGPTVTETPPKKGHRGLIITVILVALVFLIGGIAAALGGANNNKTKAGGQPTTGASTPSTNPFPSDTNCADFGTCETPTPTPNADDLTGPIGTTYTVTAQDGTEYSVTLSSISDPAKPADAYLGPDKGKRFVAARFIIKGVSGHSSDNANSMANLIGTDEQTYEADFDDVAGCTNFNSGEFSVTAGKQSVGCVVFQVPKTVKTASVTWGDTFSDSQPATWQIR
jgi:hypothetical protein